MAKELLNALKDMSADERKYLILALQIEDVEPIEEGGLEDE